MITVKSAVVELLYSIKTSLFYTVQNTLKADNLNFLRNENLTKCAIILNTYNVSITFTKFQKLNLKSQ